MVVVVMAVVVVDILVEIRIEIDGDERKVDVRNQNTRFWALSQAHRSLSTSSKAGNRSPSWAYAVS